MGFGGGQRWDLGSDNGIWGQVWGFGGGKDGIWGQIMAFGVRFGGLGVREWDLGAT